ncbi:MAG: DUF1015 domain-containing protein [Oscillospiraceae bacterium]|jgi:uncharacterized protein (DUF1015 family)|nr:DUF1015 domain-containing protein [Oscillospiraceae bacterium]
MAVIKPFQALRYDFEKAGAPETVCCPPYDVVADPSEWIDKSPYNAFLLEGGERLGTKDPYGGAIKALTAWLASGVLVEDAAPAFYIYEAAFTARDGSPRILRGFAALVELSPFSDGTVLPHEFTLSAAKEDRRRLMLQTNCQFSPVYGLYDDPSGQIAALLEPALSRPADCSFPMPDGVVHSLCALRDADLCRALSGAFADKKIFIADGHHRYETLLRLRDETGGPRHAMMFLADMNDSGVEVWETHRVVSGLKNYDETALREALEERYTLTAGDRPGGGEFVWLTVSGGWRLTPKLPSPEKSAVAALHNDILERLLGIDAENMAKQENLSYTRDAAETARLVAGGEAQCAFLLPPPKLSELRDTVLAGERMPQKSTYFYPKIITGLFMRRFS